MTEPERIAKAIEYAQALALAGFGIVEAYAPAAGGGCTCSAGRACDSPGKHPVGNGWQKRATRSPQTIAERVGKRGQYGVIPWPGEGGLILDVDHPDLLPVRLPPSLRVRRGPERGHAYFELPHGFDPGTLPATTEWGEVRVEGASRHVIGPWSRHASGDVYLPVGHPSEIAEIPVVVLADLFPPPSPEQVAANGHGYQLPEPGYRGSHYFAIRDYVAHLWGKRIRDKEEVWASVRGVLAPLFGEPLTELELRSRFERTWKGIAENLPDPATGITPAGVGPPSGQVPDHLIRQSRAAWHFAHLAGDRVRHDHGRGRWLLWAGHRWGPDEDGAVERLWLDVLADRYREALAIADNDIRLRALDAIQSAGATNAAVSAGLDLASSMEPIATRADAWDPDPWLLGCANGVVDLRTGQLRNGQPRDMISRSTGIAYDPAASCPRWERFLLEVFGGDEVLADWFGLLIGTSITAIVQELLAIHHGLGNNGKSVAARTLRRAFGDYAVAIPVETLVSAKRSAGEATPDLIPLRGARLAFTSESDQSAKLRGGVLKRLATIDRMTGRPLYGMVQTWEPTHTIHLATNHLPNVDDATEGFWRRIALIPWAVRFRKQGEPGDAPEDDPVLGDVLDRELPGILAWAVRYAVAFAGGRSLHPFPEAVRARTAAYRRDEDRLATFVDESVVYATAESVGVSDLYREYRAWTERKDTPKWERLGERTFLREFEERGEVRKVRDPSSRLWLFAGARLRLSTDRIEYIEQTTSDGTLHARREVESSGNSASFDAVDAGDRAESSFSAKADAIQAALGWPPRSPGGSA
jgi:putative DNA primase/helicase